MKKNLITLSTILLIGGLFTFTSCKKEEGCMERIADNYDVEAEVDDNSCRYSGGLSLWWSEDYSTTLQTFGYTTVTVYIDGVLVDSKSSQFYWTWSPDCGSGISKSFSLGTSKSKSVTIKVVEGGSATYNDYEAEETITILASDECLSYKWQ